MPEGVFVRALKPQAHLEDAVDSLSLPAPSLALSAAKFLALEGPGF